MNSVLLQVEECTALCKQLNSLVYDHLNELSEFMQGDLYKQYAKTASHAQIIIDDLNANLKKLQNSNADLY